MAKAQRQALDGIAGSCGSPQTQTRPEPRPQTQTQTQTKALEAFIDGSQPSWLWLSIWISTDACVHAMYEHVSVSEQLVR